jgi:hypothetical protein
MKVVVGVKCTTGFIGYLQGVHSNTNFFLLRYFPKLYTQISGINIIVKYILLITFCTFIIILEPHKSQILAALVTNVLLLKNRNALFAVVTESKLPGNMSQLVSKHLKLDEDRLTCSMNECQYQTEAHKEHYLHSCQYKLLKEVNRHVAGGKVAYFGCQQVQTFHCLLDM